MPEAEEGSREGETKKSLNGLEPWRRLKILEKTY